MGIKRRKRHFWPQDFEYSDRKYIGPLFNFLSFFFGRLLSFETSLGNAQFVLCQRKLYGFDFGLGFFSVYLIVSIQ